MTWWVGVESDAENDKARVSDRIGRNAKSSVLSR